MAQYTTLSNASTSVAVGNSAAITLNPVMRTTTVQVTAASGSSCANVYVQFTLDDPTIVGGPSVTWCALSSAIASSAVDISVGAGGALYTILSPLGGLRLSSTTAAGAGTVVTMKALQAVTG
jgi:hypothetical protein